MPLASYDATFYKILLLVACCVQVNLVQDLDQTVKVDLHNKKWLKGGINYVSYKNSVEVGQELVW